eukprot:g82021.t1
MLALLNFLVASPVLGLEPIVLPISTPIQVNKDRVVRDNIISQIGDVVELMNQQHCQCVCSMNGMVTSQYEIFYWTGENVLCDSSDCNSKACQSGGGKICSISGTAVYPLACPDWNEEFADIRDTQLKHCDAITKATCKVLGANCDSSLFQKMCHGVYATSDNHFDFPNDIDVNWKGFQFNAAHRDGLMQRYKFEALPFGNDVMDVETIIKTYTCKQMSNRAKESCNAQAKKVYTANTCQMFADEVYQECMEDVRSPNDKNDKNDRDKDGTELGCDGLATDLQKQCLHDGMTDKNCLWVYIMVESLCQDKSVSCKANIINTEQKCQAALGSKDGGQELCALIGWQMYESQCDPDWKEGKWIDKLTHSHVNCPLLMQAMVQECYSMGYKGCSHFAEIAYFLCEDAAHDGEVGCKLSVITMETRCTSLLVEKGHMMLTEASALCSGLGVAAYVTVCQKDGPDRKQCQDTSRSLVKKCEAADGTSKEECDWFKHFLNDLCNSGEEVMDGCVLKVVGVAARCEDLMGESEKGVAFCRLMALDLLETTCVDPDTREQKQEIKKQIMCQSVVNNLKKQCYYYHQKDKESCDLLAVNMAEFCREDMEDDMGCKYTVYLAESSCKRLMAGSLHGDQLCVMFALELYGAICTVEDGPGIGKDLTLQANPSSGKHDDDSASSRSACQKKAEMVRKTCKSHLVQTSKNSEVMMVDDQICDTLARFVQKTLCNAQHHDCEELAELAMEDCEVHHTGQVAQGKCQQLAHLFEYELCAALGFEHSYQGNKDKGNKNKYNYPSKYHDWTADDNNEQQDKYPDNGNYPYTAWTAEDNKADENAKQDKNDERDWERRDGDRDGGNRPDQAAFNYESAIDSIPAHCKALLKALQMKCLESGKSKEQCNSFMAVAMHELC